MQFEGYECPLTVVLAIVSQLHCSAWELPDGSWAVGEGSAKAAAIPWRTSLANEGLSNKWAKACRISMPHWVTYVCLLVVPIVPVFQLQPHHGPTFGVG